MIKRIFFGIVSVLSLCFVLYFGVWTYAVFISRDDWKARTIPLSEEKRADLCAKFVVTQVEICTPQAVVYGPEFYKYIDAFFESGVFSQEMVEGKLGPYLLECSSLKKLQNGQEYYSCDYDLAGDEKFPILVHYDAYGFLIKLVSNTD